jgi:hypothetical protein
VNPEGHVLTPRNQCLIYFQNTQALKLSVVAGYRQWQKYQRQVKKGSTGFVITVPSKNQSSNDEDENVFFLHKTVYDISQTEEVPNIT